MTLRPALTSLVPGLFLVAASTSFAGWAEMQIERTVRTSPQCKATTVYWNSRDYTATTWKAKSGSNARMTSTVTLCRPASPAASPAIRATP